MQNTENIRIQIKRRCQSKQLDTAVSYEMELKSLFSAVLAVVSLCKFFLVVFDTVFVVVVLDRLLNCLLGKQRAVQLVRAKSIKSLHVRLIGELKRLRQRLALYHLGSH